MSETDWSVTDECVDEGKLYSISGSSGPFTMLVKWDGCVDVHRERQATPDHLHLCGAEELDAMIERLTKLRELALQKFGENWREER